jgi:lysine 6-dehydrogenase
LGLWSTKPVRVGEQEVVPRDLFHVLFAPRVTFPDDRDVVAIRIRATGRKDGRAAEVTLELVDQYDEETGFTAMERTTGWDGAIVAAMMARGQTPRGAVPVELAVPPALFVDEMRRRGFQLQERVSLL